MIYDDLVAAIPSNIYKVDKTGKPATTKNDMKKKSDDNKADREKRKSQHPDKNIGRNVDIDA